jgi:radical SAM protein with 4Fe4S-binding SPASM domain
MCIESNGDVLPCQSYYTSLGNFLRDDWDSIWNHKLAVQLRERQNLPFKCETCELVAECGGGCPLQFSGVQNLPILA